MVDNRWNKLINIITKIGPLETKNIEIDNVQREGLFAGKNLLIINLGYLKNKTIMKGWLNHLLFCSEGAPPDQTIVITRNSTYGKKDDFKIAYKWTGMEPSKAKEYIEGLKDLTNQGRSLCWPAPPDSSLSYALAKNKTPHKAVDHFNRKWIGNLHSPGERDYPHMELCFGSECKPSDFLENKHFFNAFNLLYQPIFDLKEN